MKKGLRKIIGDFRKRKQICGIIVHKKSLVCGIKLHKTVFALVGCVFEENYYNNLKIKYFASTDIILHDNFKPPNTSKNLNHYTTIVVLKINLLYHYNRIVI